MSRRGKTKLRVASQWYTVTVQDRPPIDGNTACFGLHYGNTKQIDLEEQKDPLRSIQVALHEVLHALDEQCTLGLSEDEVKRLGLTLGATLFDNMSWWMKMGLGEAPGMGKWTHVKKSP